MWNLRKLFLLFIFNMFLLTSCNSDDGESNDDGNGDEISNQIETLNGIWNLKNVSGGFQLIDVDYQQGDVIWDFNLENETLTVENNIETTGIADIYAGLESGTYNIEIVENDETETLFIDDVKKGVVLLKSATNLKIDDGFESDGYIIEFER